MNLLSANPCTPLRFEYGKSAVDLFSEVVERFAESLAITDEYGTWTYAELDEITDRLGRHCAERGWSDGSTVAIYAQRCAVLVAAIIGVWKSGAAVAVLDSAYPEHRLIQGSTQARVNGMIALQPAGLPPEELLHILSPGSGAALSIAGSPAEIKEQSWYVACGASGEAWRRSSLLPDATAYILFTSGTTGQPKAIATPHHALPHFLSWYHRTLGTRGSDRTTMLSGLSHDPLFRDMFVPLTSGGSLHIPPASTMRLPRRLLAWIRSQEISIAHLTPSLGRMLCSIPRAADGTLQHLRLALFGGERLRFDDVRGFAELAPRAQVVNCYGATETPQIMGYALVSAEMRQSLEGNVPITSCIDDVQIFVVGEDGCIAGTGEVVVRTRYLSKGYVGQDELTSKRFIRNTLCADGKEPSDADLLYRTGDRGSVEDGAGLQILGRVDNQVKIRGFRVELEEVECALRGQPNVRNAAATVTGPADDPSIRAWVEAEEGFDRSACLKSMRESLPSYMVPGEIVEIMALPLTPNGKLDRSQLLSAPHTVLKTHRS